MPEKASTPDTAETFLPAAMALALRSGWGRGRPRCAHAHCFRLLEGDFIAFGAIFMTVVLTCTSELPWHGDGGPRDGLRNLTGETVYIDGGYHILS
jgi:hypothetical protein